MMRNPDQHPILLDLTKPLLEQDIPFKLNSLWSMVGMEDLRAPPRRNSMCFRWMLEIYEGVPNDDTKYRVQPVNIHPTTTQAPDDYTTKFSKLLKPGVYISFERDRKKMINVTEPRASVPLKASCLTPTWAHVPLAWNMYRANIC